MTNGLPQRVSKQAWPWLLAGAVGVLLCLWPQRAAWWIGDVPGSGPDVASTLWGMWWFGQEWSGAAWGGQTDLVNHPHGALGTVLSPVSAVLWNLFRPLLGIGRAATVVGAAQLAATGLATAWLARVVGVKPLGAVAAGMATLVCRYAFYGLGEASVVAVCAFGVPLGLGLLLRVRAGAWPVILGAAACMPLVAVENPYLAPVLPAAALCVAFRAETRRSVCLTAVLGVIGTLVVAALFGQVASPEYPADLSDEVVSLMGVDWNVVHHPWAAVSLGELAWPSAVQWTTDEWAGTAARGGHYMGISVLVLSVCGAVWRWRMARPWLGLGVLASILALGSNFGGLPGPFLLLNQIMDLVARPLTQPVRFLILASVGLGVVVGFAVDAVGQRWGRRGAVGAVSLVVVDALVLGGLSLDLPKMGFPRAGCVSFLAEEQGAVLVWPGDGSRHEGDLMRVWMLQLLHERPSPHPGIASWVLLDGKSRESLAEHGFHYTELGRHHTGELDPPALADKGYRWLVIDHARDPHQLGWARTHFGEPVAECDDAVVHRIGMDQ